VHDRAQIENDAVSIGNAAVSGNGGGTTGASLHTNGRNHTNPDEADAAARLAFALVTRRKQKAATMSIVVTTSLTLSKLVIGVMTGSIAIISEALHSMMDMVAALVAFFSIKLGGEPADRKHHYGHTKFEVMGAFIEGIIIFIPYIFVLYYAVRNIFNAKLNTEMLGWGMVLMAISTVANFACSAFLTRVARATHSIALRGDSLHLFADGMTSAALLIALYVIKLTGLEILDPLFAIGVSIYIIYVSLILLMRASVQLVDAAPPEDADILERINATVKDLPDRAMSVHSFRCRGTRPSYFIDFHLECCRFLTIDESHELCDELEARIKSEFPQSDVTVHVEPCEDKGCALSRGEPPVCGTWIREAKS
jgi:cation diffusion facilitator family transporter